MKVLYSLIPQGPGCWHALQMGPVPRPGVQGRLCLAPLLCLADILEEAPALVCLLSASLASGLRDEIFLSRASFRIHIGLRCSLAMLQPVLHFRKNFTCFCGTPSFLRDRGNYSHCLQKPKAQPLTLSSEGSLLNELLGC